VGLPQHVKPFFLLACFVFCLATLFTSNFLERGDLPILPTAIGLNKLCQKTPDRTTYRRCERAVRQAYRHINLGGCPFQIQQNSLCETEWCLDRSTALQCTTECANVNTELSECVERIIHSYFTKFGVDYGDSPSLHDSIK
jgi:hypothetical protein